MLSNVCFPNHDVNNKTGQIAINQKNNYGSTIAHSAAHNPTPDTVKTFKLLKRYNFNFNIYNYYGALPIHYACWKNNYELLTWMINENIFEKNAINEKTKYAKDTQYNNKTPLMYALTHNGVECVNVLCHQPGIEITEEDITRTLFKDHVKIFKLLMYGLFIKFKISQWSDIEKHNKDKNSLISCNTIGKMISFCQSRNKDKCHSFLLDFYNNGYLARNYNYIARCLNYNFTHT